MRWLLVILLLPISLIAQQWSGIIDPTRAADWTSSGVAGGIPSTNWANCTTAACNTLNSGTVTGSSINSALSSAGSVATSANPLVVRIPAGTFTISDSCISHQSSNVVLRGQGADTTKLILNATCTGGGLGTSRAISLMSGSAGVGCGTSCGGTPPSQTANWTAGYAQGTTSITLDNTAGITAGPVGQGTIIFLDQNDDTASAPGFPTGNDVIQCSEDATWCSDKGDGDHWGRPGRALIQAVTVTAISGSTVTISPGVAFPTIRSGQAPGAWWNTSQIHNAGIENMSLDMTGADNGYGIFIKDGSNLWVVGTRQINTATGTAAFYNNWVMNVSHVTLESNYYYGKNTTCNPFPLENYTITTKESSDVVMDNNIFQHTNNAYVPNDPEDRNVFGYNYIVGSVVGGAGAQPHSGLDAMDLYEGNDWQSYYGDVTHGSKAFVTLYRNVFDGTQNNNSCTVGQAITIMTNNRFYNAVANVIGNTSYSPYEENVGNTSSASNAIFELGWIGNNSFDTGPVSADANVKRTLLRWGNWDYLTSTSPTGTNDQTGVRWCGNSTDTGWTTTCSSTSEVPSAISSFANPEPTKGDTTAGQAALPASFYMTTAPSWFGTIPFPPIGPDVANGNSTNTSTTPSGGHVNKIPSRVCYESLATDSAYSTGIKVFNANTCYGSISNPPTPSMSVSPTSLAFGSEFVNTTTPTQAVTLTSTGTAPLAISSIAIGGTNGTSFTQSNNCPITPATLAVNSSCTINVACDPTIVGSLTGTLTVTSNANNSPQSVSLAGTGITANPTNTQGSGNNVTFSGGAIMR